MRDAPSDANALPGKAAKLPVLGCESSLRRLPGACPDPRRLEVAPPGFPEKRGSASSAFPNALPVFARACRCASLNERESALRLQNDLYGSALHVVRVTARVARGTFLILPIPSAGQRARNQGSSRARAVIATEPIALTHPARDVPHCKAPDRLRVSLVQFDTSQSSSPFWSPAVAQRIVRGPGAPLL